MDLQDPKYRKHIESLFEKFGEPKSIDDIGHFVVAVINDYLKDKGNEVIGLAWFGKYEHKVSISHCCPIGKISIWRSSNLEPRGFPGFYGRVYLRLRKEIDYMIYSCDDMFNQTYTYTGTGGSGSYWGVWGKIESVSHKHLPIDEWPNLYSWDYRFFLSDFPLIEQEFNNQSILHALNGESHKILEIKHNFLWEDEETKKRDLLLMEKFK